MYRVDEAACTGCGDCAEACPTGAIALMDDRARIDDATCAECGSCADVCPQGAIVMAACLTHPTSLPSDQVSVVSLEAPVVEPPRLIPRPTAEALPIAPRPSRVWPVIGGALVWAARELLPEVLTAWRSSRAGAIQPASRQSAGHTATSVQIVSQQPRAGHRHRWGRA